MVEKLVLDYTLQHKKIIQLGNIYETTIYRLDNK